MPSLSRCPRCQVRHTPRCDMPTWPVAPLLALLGPNPTARLNVSGAELDRRITEGLSEIVADRWAVRCGYHPSEVWGPVWSDAGLTVVDRMFLETGWRPAWLAAEASRVAS